MIRLTVADIMVRTEATLFPDMDIYRALKHLLKSQVSGAPVVARNGVLLGMLTERDCLKVLIGGALDSLPPGTVSDYMSAPAESIGPAASFYDVVHIFLTRAYRKLPVVDDDGHVIGQVSRRDALAVLESFRDDPRLYGTEDERPPDGPGVDSAMKIARRQR